MKCKVEKVITVTAACIWRIPWYFRFRCSRSSYQRCQRDTSEFIVWASEGVVGEGVAREGVGGEGAAGVGEAVVGEGEVGERMAGE